MVAIASILGTNLRARNQIPLRHNLIPQVAFSPRPPPRPARRARASLLRLLFVSFVPFCSLRRRLSPAPCPLLLSPVLLSPAPCGLPQFHRIRQISGPLSAPF